MINSNVLLSTVTYGGPSKGQAACSSTLECLVAEALEPSVVLVGLLVVSVAVGHLADAIDVVETERKRGSAERTALEVFADRVAVLEVGNPATPPTAPDRFGMVTDGGGTTDQVGDAYRETVMSVPHYESEVDRSRYTTSIGMGSHRPGVPARSESGIGRSGRVTRSRREPLRRR